MMFAAKWLSVAVGMLLLLAALTAMFDPTGTQLADDSDPFGATNLILRSSVLLAAALVLIVWPFALHIWRRRR